MESRYRSAKTLQATFLERYTEGGQTVRTEAGVAYFRRPGQMRWEYERPEKDIFLVDGKTAWFYVPSDHTVTRIPARKSTDFRTPLALLAGETKISRFCARVELSEAVKPQNEADAVLRCVPKGEKQRAAESAETVENSADEIFIELVRATGELARLVVRQPAGVQVEFRFENWQFDPVIPASMFRFQPPPGVAIVNGELPEGNAGMNVPSSSPY